MIPDRANPPVSVSKTDQLVGALREKIANGAYPQGTTLPSERSLTEEFGVSRVTVRKALERLTDAGLVARSPGKGTYVRSANGGVDPFRAVVGPIALVSSQLTPSVASPIAAGCSSAALEHRSQLILCDTGGATFAEAHAREALHLRELYQQGVPAVIIWWQGGDASKPWLERMLAEGRAVVMMDRYLEGLGADFVGIDDENAAYQAVMHLAQQGRRRIACVVNALKVTTSSGRLAGYRRALADLGLPFDDELVMIVEEGASDVGARVAERIVSSRPKADGLLAVNDYVAIAVIEGLEARGVCVPDDIATVSFADMEVARHYRVPLTTVHQPFRAIGETAVHLVIERLETKRVEPRRVLLPSSLVVRRSSGVSES